MKCYTISGINVQVGIESAKLPIDRTLIGLPGDRVTDAILCPVTREREDIDFPELFKSDLTAAIASCRVVFSAPRKDLVASNRALVAYDPRELYPDRQLGDTSQLVFRSRELFVRMAEPDSMALGFVRHDDSNIFVLKATGPQLITKPRVLMTLPEEEEEEDFFVAFIS